MPMAKKEHPSNERKTIKFGKEVYEEFYHYIPLEYTTKKEEIGVS